MVAVDVADLTLADGVLHAAEAMRSGGHAFPGCNGFGNLFLCTLEAHDYPNRQVAENAKIPFMTPRLLGDFNNSLASLASWRFKLFSLY